MTNVAPPAAGRIHEFTTHSGADTVEVGRQLVRLLAAPQLLILRGDLGTGKTTLVKGIAQALDAAEPDEVTSPTFTLIHEYDGGLDGKPVKLFHLDVYRLEGERWCWWSGARSSRASARRLLGRSSSLPRAAMRARLP
jgi:tRNA threonylcarbamoyladenosine biosynthesis protein TsaE